MILKLYLIAFPVFLAIDMIWLGLISRNFYAKHIGFLMKTNVNWVAAILFYLLFILGIVIFVVSPGLVEGSWFKVLILGSLFGLVTYATYDLTNLATLKDWPLLVTVVDLVWGTFISAAVSLITFFIALKLNL